MSESLMLNGPAGQLQVLIDSPADWQDNQPVAIVCHPHPLHGGSMQNKVVHILAKTFVELGARVVRFNFRGVGKSEGEFDNAAGEQDDLLAVVNWVHQQWPAAPLWLAGFSFGAYIAAATEQRVAPARLVLVAPPVDMYPAIHEISIQSRDWFLVQGDRDEIVDPASVELWEQQQAISARRIWLSEAGHFFHGRLNELKEQLTGCW